MSVNIKRIPQSEFFLHKLYNRNVKVEAIHFS